MYGIRNSMKDLVRDSFVKTFGIKSNRKIIVESYGRKTSAMTLFSGLLKLKIAEPC
jgi:hypothetical protein